jgi:hypothetical protein
LIAGIHAVAAGGACLSPKMAVLAHEADLIPE